MNKKGLINTVVIIVWLLLHWPVWALGPFLSGMLYQMSGGPWVYLVIVAIIFALLLQFNNKVLKWFFGLWLLISIVLSATVWSFISHSLGSEVSLVIGTVLAYGVPTLIIYLLVRKAIVSRNK